MRPRGWERRAEAAARAVLAVGLIGAGVSELARSEAVMSSLELLGQPPYLVWILGPAKLVAAVVLLAPGPTWLRDAAFTGVFIDLGGAIASFALVGAWPLPDAVVAPAYLAVAATAFALHRRSPEDAAEPTAPPRSLDTGVSSSPAQPASYT